MCYKKIRDIIVEKFKKKYKEKAQEWKNIDCLIEAQKYDFSVRRERAFWLIGLVIVILFGLKEILLITIPIWIYLVGGLIIVGTIIYEVYYIWEHIIALWTLYSIKDKPSHKP